MHFCTKDSSHVTILLSHKYYLCTTYMQDNQSQKIKDYSYNQVYHIYRSNIQLLQYYVIYEIH